MIKKIIKIKYLILIMILFTISNIHQTGTIYANNTISDTVKNSVIFVIKESIGFSLKCAFNHPKLVFLGGGALICIGTILTFREFVKKIEKTFGIVAIVSIGAIGILTIGNYLDNKSRIKKGTLLN